jgi:hypothetical protein
LFPEVIVTVSSGDTLRGTFCCCCVGWAKADCLPKDNNEDKVEKANIENTRINIMNRAMRFFMTL